MMINNKIRLEFTDYFSLIFAPIEISMRTITWIQRNKNTKQKPTTIVIGFCFVPARRNHTMNNPT